jgi:cation:H+ antiporter
MTLATFQLVAGVVLLGVGAEALVRGSTSLALRIGMSPLVVGLTVVAFGTSAPELVATVVAALKGSGDLALGNVIGSNISNVTLVIGLAALVRPITVSRQITRRDAPIVIGLSVVLVLFLLDRTLQRWEGLVFFVGIVAYTSWSVMAAKRHENSILEAAVEEQSESRALHRSLWVAMLLTLIGLGGLAGGAHVFVEGAQAIARFLGVPEVVIGLTMMAIGTSLPEIATVVAASTRSMSDLVTGNVIGSNIFNILCVLGIAATVLPLRAETLTRVDLLVFLGTAILIWAAMQFGRTISRLEGAGLVLVYVVYATLLFFR